ncbi:EthD domain-containing protein [Occultella gossypii]|uniref:EthD family reductase n=1 Tax=Occultella gossypii TaxID=2800820 RepID=A0ABS7S8D7_9MICO|nr:EthD domain-containing protein [Occultella gossypii]MBZ2195458.1 EthD family reductase [Occultella gossypii]
MSKRITYLERRDGMTPADFSSYWRGRHAPIAVDLPGVVCYRQNHVIPGSVAEGAAYAVDGIVELWFASDHDAQAGLTTDVSDRLIVDEPNFLAGLTGGPVDGPAPAAPAPAMLWVLARWRHKSPDRQVLERLRTLRIPGTRGLSVNLLDQSRPLLVRDALRRMTTIPDLAISAGFDTRDAAVAGRRTLQESLAPLVGDLRDVQTMLSSTVSIVEAAR